MHAHAFRKWHLELGRACFIAAVVSAGWWIREFLRVNTDSSIPIVFASGAAVACAVLFGLRALWVVAPVSYAWSAGSGAAAGDAALIAAVLTAEAAVAWAACPRRALRPDLDRIRDVAVFFVACAVAAPLAGSLVRAAWLFLAGTAPAAGLFTEILYKWARDATGVLVFAPLVMVWWAHPRFVGSKRWVREGLVCVCLVALSLPPVYYHWFGRFPHQHLLAFAPVPFAVWAVFRLGQKGASAVVFITCLGVAHETGHGHDFTHLGSLFPSWGTVWAFLGTLSLTLHAMGALVSDRKQFEAMNRERERYFETLIESTSDIVTVLEANGMIRYESPSIRKLLGYDRQELIGTNVFDLVHPEDVSRAFQALAEAIPTPGAERKVECRFRHKDGRWRQLETHGVNLLHDPTVRGIILTTRDRTEQQEARQRMQEHLEFIETLLDTVPSPIFYKDASGKYLGCNQAFERFIGRPRSEIIGGTVDDLSPPDLAARYRRADGELMAKPGRQVYESRVRSSDGAEREVIFYKATFGGPPQGPPAGIVGAALDITQLKEAEKRLRLQSAALEAAANSIVIVDRQGRIQWANQAFTRTTGYAVEEVKGQNLRILKSGRHEESFYKNLWDTILSGRVWSSELVNRRKDGSLYPEEMTVTPLVDGSGEITHFIAIKQDITERRNLEKQFLQAQKMEAVGRLAGGIAHDFNNLLTVIIGYCELAAGRAGLEAETRANLAEIRKASKRAVALTDQLLAFSRHQMTQPQVVDLDAVVAEMAEMLGRLIGSDIRLSIDSPERPARVKIDLAQVEQVVMNLAVNARDAMPKGGSLRISTGRMDVGAEMIQTFPEMTPGPYAFLKVEDTGSGMTEEVRAHLFEPFFTTKPKNKGTGLGLPTVYGIVKNAKGHVWFDTEPGKGTTCTVCLPYCFETPVAHAQTTSEPVTGEWRASGVVMVAEDEEPVRRLICEVLRQHGYDVVEAANGVEALLKLKRSIVDVLLTDIVMPEMDGRDLILRARGMFPSMGIVAMSAYADGLPDIQQTFLKENEHFVKKPFVAENLLRIISTAVAERRPDRPEKA